MAKIRKFTRFILPVVSLIILPYITQAQNYYIEESNTFFGGPILGANFTQVDGDNYAGYHKAGINVGGIVFTKFAERFAASLEILYTQKGSKGHVPIRSNSSTYEIQKYGINLNYAEVPIMLHIMDKRKSMFGMGLSYSQLVSSKETITTNSQAFNDTVDLSRYPFKKYDLNFIIGANLRIYKGFYFNLRFQYSLLPIRKDIYKEFGRAEQYNNLYTLRFIYIFGQKY